MNALLIIVVVTLACSVGSTNSQCETFQKAYFRKGDRHFFRKITPDHMREIEAAEIAYPKMREQIQTEFLEPKIKISHSSVQNLFQSNGVDERKSFVSRVLLYCMFNPSQSFQVAADIVWREMGFDKPIATQ